MFVMLQRHRQGRLISVIVVSIGFLGSITGAMITSKSVFLFCFFFLILHLTSKKKTKQTKKRHLFISDLLIVY